MGVFGLRLGIRQTMDNTYPQGRTGVPFVHDPDRWQRINNDNTGRFAEMSGNTTIGGPAPAFPPDAGMLAAAAASAARGAGLKQRKKGKEQSVLTGLQPSSLPAVPARLQKTMLGGY
jgi:hypothetical protein